LQEEEKSKRELRMWWQETGRAVSGEIEAYRYKLFIKYQKKGVKVNLLLVREK
jgi:hypothetical protein